MNGEITPENTVFDVSHIEPCPVCGATPQQVGRRVEIIHDAAKHQGAGTEALRNTPIAAPRRIGDVRGNIFGDRD